MIRSSKRYSLAAVVAFAALLLVGCGKKTETPAATPPKAEPLKIAFAYVGPVGDGGSTMAVKPLKKSLATKSSPPSRKMFPSRLMLNE